jgi:hypothetical protein
METWNYAVLLSFLQPSLMDPISRVPYPVTEVPYDESLTAAVRFVARVAICFERLRKIRIDIGDEVYNQEMMFYTDPERVAVTQLDFAASC